MARLLAEPLTATRSDYVSRKDMEQEQERMTANAWGVSEDADIVCGCESPCRSATAPCLTTSCGRVTVHGGICAATNGTVSTGVRPQGQGLWAKLGLYILSWGPSSGGGCPWLSGAQTCNMRPGEAGLPRGADGSPLVGGACTAELTYKGAGGADAWGGGAAESCAEHTEREREEEGAARSAHSALGEAAAHVLEACAARVANERRAAQLLLDERPLVDVGYVRLPAAALSDHRLGCLEAQPAPPHYRKKLQTV